jgi:hypothetical protein
VALDAVHAQRGRKRRRGLALPVLIYAVATTTTRAQGTRDTALTEPRHTEMPVAAFMLPPTVPDTSLAL